MAPKTDVTPVPKDSSPPKPLIPLAGNLVTFPVEADPTDQVGITWAQNKAPQSAIYYKLRCWFGQDRKVDKDTTVFETFGESIIFIAAEYLDPKYEGPVTQLKHILTIKDGLRGKWAMLKLDRRFMYGQDKPMPDTTSRFIVYHPPIGREPPRVIFQHRFGQNVIVNLSEQLFKSGKASGDARLWVLSTLAKAVADVAKSMTGDKLHEFEDANADALIAQLGLFQKQTDFNLPINKKDAFEPEALTEGFTRQDVRELETLLVVLKEANPSPGFKISKGSKIKLPAIDGHTHTGPALSGSEANPLPGGGTTQPQPHKPTTNLPVINPRAQQKIAKVTDANRVASAYPKMPTTQSDNPSGTTATVHA